MEITVDVKNATGKYILRQSIGDGHCEGYEFELDSGIPDGSLIITANDSVYLVSSGDVVQAVIVEIIREKAEAQ